MYALDAASGELKWKFKVDDSAYAHFTSPQVANGVLYAGGDTGRLYALDIKTGDFI